MAKNFWKELANLPPLNEIQRLNFQRGFLIRQKERLKSHTFRDDSGVYGTAVSDHSSNTYACKEIDEMVKEIDERISEIQENKLTGF